MALFSFLVRKSDLCYCNLLAKLSLSPIYCKLHELQGMEQMPESFLKPFVSLLRKYFLVVLFVLYTNLTLDGTSLLIFSFSYSGGKTSVFS